METAQKPTPTILFLCGMQPHHLALRAKLEAVTPLAATIMRHQRRVGLPRRVWETSGRVIGRGMFGLSLRQSWKSVMANFDRSRTPAISPVMVVADINDDRVIARVATLRPDLVIVSGTNILRAALIAAIRQSGVIINLHTGISPWVKGAPNSTNWCLANRTFGLIGNTVHWLDDGIDSGNIIATERTALTGEEDLDTLHRKVLDHGQDLLLRAVARHLQGSSLHSVAQDELGEGKLYLQRHWTGWTALKAILNFRRLFRPANIDAGLTGAMRLIALDSPAT